MAKSSHNKPVSPFEHIAGPEFLKEIAEILSIACDPKRANFELALVHVCREMRILVQDTPSSLPASKIRVTISRRIDWLEDKIISHTKSLRNALHDQNEPYFSTWPDEIAGPNKPDRSELLTHLAILEEFAVKLRDELNDQRFVGYNHSTDLKATIVRKLLKCVHEYYPDKCRSRGQWHAGHGWIGEGPEFIRCAFSEITGWGAHPDTWLRDALK